MAALLDGEAIRLAGNTEASPIFSDPIRAWYSCISVVLMIDLLIRQASRLLRDDRGADLVEYGLIGGMIAAAGVAFFPTIFDKLGDAFEDWGNNVYEEWEPDNPIPPPDPDPQP